MRSVMIAALIGAVPAVARAEHETPLVGVVEQSPHGPVIQGVVLSGADLSRHCGTRVEAYGRFEGRGRHRRFCVTSFRPIPEPCRDLTVRGSIANRPPGRAWAGYAIAGTRFDPACIRGVTGVCGDAFEVKIRPRPDDPRGARYVVVAWSESTRWVHDGCRWVRIPRFGSDGGYAYENGRWSDGACRTYPGGDRVCVAIR